MSKHTLRAALFGAALLFTAPAMAMGHGGSIEQESFFTAIQHRFADVTGIGAFHPATNHGTHRVWQAVIPQLQNVTDDYMGNPDIAANMAVVNGLFAQYRNLPVEVLDNGDAPEQGDLHRMADAAGKALEALYWLDSANPKVTELLETHATLQQLLGTDALCTVDALKPTANATLQAKALENPAFKRIFVTGLLGGGVLLVAGWGIALIRRRKTA